MPYFDQQPSVLSTGAGHAIRSDPGPAAGAGRHRPGMEQVPPNQAASPTHSEASPLSWVSPGSNSRSEDHSCCRAMVARSAHSGPTAVDGHGDLVVLVSPMMFVHKFLLSDFGVAGRCVPAARTEMGRTVVMGHILGWVTGAASGGRTPGTGGDRRNMFLDALGGSIGRYGSGSGLGGDAWGGLPTKNKKEPLPKKRLLDGSRPCQCLCQSVESASRTALALDTSASLLQAVEIPAIDTAMEGGPESTSFWSSSAACPCFDGLPMSLTAPIVADQPPRASSLPEQLRKFCPFRS